MGAGIKVSFAQASFNVAVSQFPVACKMKYSQLQHHASDHDDNGLNSKTIRELPQFNFLSYKSCVIMVSLHGTED